MTRKTTVATSIHEIRLQGATVLKTNIQSKMVNTTMCHDSLQTHLCCYDWSLNDLIACFSKICIIEH